MISVKERMIGDTKLFSLWVPFSRENLITMVVIYHQFKPHQPMMMIP